MIRMIVYLQNKKSNESDRVIFQLVNETKLNLDENEIKILQVEEKEEYNNMKKFHIENEKIIIDEVYKKELSNEEKLEKELLETKAAVVDLKYKEILEKEGR